MERMDLKFKLIIKRNTHTFDVLKCTLDDKDEDHIAACKTLENAKWVMDALAQNSRR